MEKIQNYNCDGMCIQQSCSKKYTRMTTQKIKNIEVVLGFCDEHAEHFENYSG